MQQNQAERPSLADTTDSEREPAARGPVAGPRTGTPQQAAPGASLATMSSDALQQSLANVTGTAGAATDAINRLPNAVRAAADAQKEHIAVINSLADNHGDYGGMLDENLRSTNELAREFNILSPLALQMRQNFASAEMGGRSFADMGITAAGAFSDFNQIFNETTFLQSLYSSNQEYIAAAAGEDVAAIERVNRLAERMPVFKKALGLTNEELQTFYDVQRTLGGQTTDKFLADMSNITLSLRGASFNVNNLASHIAGLTEDFKTFGHLGPEAIAEFAVLSQELGLDNPERLAGLVPSLQSYEGLVEFQSEISNIMQKGINLDVASIMPAMITDPAAGMQMLIGQLEEQGVFEGLSDEESIVKRNMIADLFGGMGPDELLLIAQNAGELDSRMDAANQAIADGRAAIQERADALMEEARVRGDETLTMEEALIQASSDEAAAQVREGVQTERLDTSASDVAQEQIAAQTAAPGIRTAQAAANVTGTGLELVASQATQLGQTINTDLEGAVTGLVSNVHATDIAMQLMTTAANAHSEQTAAGTQRYATDQERLSHVLSSLQTTDFQTVDEDGEVGYNAEVAASLVATARGLQQGMVGLTGDAREQQQQLFQKAMTQAKAAGATGLTANNLQDLNIEEIFGDLAAEVQDLGDDTSTGSVAGTMTGMMDELGDSEQVARQQEAMTEFWSAALQTESPTPPEAEVMEPWRNYFQGVKNLARDKMGDLFDGQSVEVPVEANTASFTEGAVPPLSGPETPDMPIIESGESKLSDLDAWIAAMNKVEPDTLETAETDPLALAEQMGNQMAEMSGPSRLSDLEALMAMNEGTDPEDDGSLPEYMAAAQLSMADTALNIQNIYDAQAAVISSQEAPDVSQIVDADEAINAQAAAMQSVLQDALGAQSLAAAQPAPQKPITPGATGGGGDTVIKVYIDSVEFMSAIAGAPGVAGIMVDALEDYGGSQLAFVSDVRSSTGIS